MWAANGSDAATIKLMMTEGSDMGWMGLGWNMHGSMKGADMWVVHRQRQGWAVTDALAVAFARPIADQSQDVILRSMEYKTGVWSAVMSRKLKPCDLAGDLEIVPGQQLVMLWAHGSVARNSFSGVTYHGPGFKNKGSVGVTLLAEEVLSQRSALQAADQAADQHAPVASSEAPEPLPVTDAHVEAIVRKFMHARDASADNARRGTAPAVCTSSKCDASAEQARQQPATYNTAAAVATQASKYTPPPVTKNADGTLSVDIKCPRSAIPAEVTTYLVCYTLLPADQKYHIVRYDSLLGSRLVHHSLTYTCEPGSQAEADAKQLLAANGTGPFNLDTHVKKCAQIYMAAPPRKAPPNILPQEVGLPFGKDSFQVFIVEMHYNNPTGASGMSDTGSGLRLTFQPASVRGVDAGFLTIGQFILDIPPGQPDYAAQTATCTPACTRRFKQNLTIINQAFHAHALGKSFRTNWVRNGVELKPLTNLKRFDQAYAQWLPSDPVQRVLMPGDQLSLTCTYNSMGRKNVTQWGWTAQDEMCMWFIMYYPAQEVAFCAHGFTPLLPLTVCSASSQEATALYEPYIAGNFTQVFNIVKDTVTSGRGILQDPVMRITKPYNLSQGCSSDKPL
ncbi:hypothetical protein OEZ86_010341 [Tetradesmus obliquus]|nr:hypothetical protein OEZ86_010341 [Tetradesmus obliquus]